MLHPTDWLQHPTNQDVGVFCPKLFFYLGDIFYLTSQSPSYPNIPSPSLWLGNVMPSTYALMLKNYIHGSVNIQANSSTSQRNHPNNIPHVFNGVQHPTCSVFGSSSNHEEVSQSSYAFIMNDCTYQDAFAHSILKNVTILLPKRLYHPTHTIPSTSHSIVGATFKLTSIPSTSYMVEVGVATSH